MDLEAQRQYYDERWKAEEFANSIAMLLISKVLEFLSELELAPPPAICDFGCGAGWNAAILGVFGKVVGVDLSDVSAARARYPHCEFHTANALEWDWPANSFDVVVSMEVIEHIEKPDQGKYLIRARRILKPGGYLLLTTPNSATLNAIRGGGRTWTNQPIENWLDARQLRELLEENGFKILRRTTVSLGLGELGAYRLVNSYKLAQVLKALRLHGWWQQAARAAGFGAHFVVLAQSRSTGSQ